MRRALTVVATPVLVTAVLALSACGSQPKAESAPPPTAPVSAGSNGTLNFRDRTADPTAPDDSVEPDSTDASPAGAATRRPGGASTQTPPPTQAQVVLPPPPTYDPALQPWCDTLVGPAEAAASGASNENVAPLVNLVGPLQNSLPLAPPAVADATTRLIDVLELLADAVASGEVTDKESMLRWGLVNLAPDQITTLQSDLYTLTGFVDRNCPKN